MVTKKLQKSFKWIGIILLLTIHGEIKINSTEQLDFLIKYLIGERGDKINVPEDYFSKRALLRSLMTMAPLNWVPFSAKTISPGNGHRLQS